MAISPTMYSSFVAGGKAHDTKIAIVATRSLRAAGFPTGYTKESRTCQAGRATRFHSDKLQRRVASFYCVMPATFCSKAP